MGPVPGAIRERAGAFAFLLRKTRNASCGDWWWIPEHTFDILMIAVGQIKILVKNVN